MKSLEELHEIRERMQGIIGLRAENADQILVTVGVSESGKAAGAGKVLTTLSDAVQEQNLTHKIRVTQDGYLEMSGQEPVMEVVEKGKDKVVYVKMTPEKALEVLSTHLLGGQVAAEYTSAAQEQKES